MTPAQHARIKELFLAACGRPAGERMAFVAEACGADAELRAAVEQLLGQHSEPPAAAPGADARPATRTDPQATLLERAARDFPPGTLVAERYRIVALLGRGGMGDVYRAEDLTLEQTVALKFLPLELSRDPAWVARLRHEVRVAREITNAHVCRIYDIGSTGTDWFISMEYVDGEDLRTLLRRIGRLPSEKGLDIARQLCIGLAAAHARGVLHRDLKPSNVMLDGEGRVRVMDFGLAAARGALVHEDIRSGTPAYMAPEQLEGREVSERSDIYALGLVLYELLSGKPAFPADSLAALARRSSLTATPVSSQGCDVDPRVEAVVLRCLEADPNRRPPSVLAVLAALPGGDALAVAQAVGAVPSPSLVAVSRAAGRLSALQRTTALALGCALLVIIALFAVKAHPLARGAADRPPAVLAEKAREVLAQLGWPAGAPSEAWGFRSELAVPLAAGGGETEPGALFSDPECPLVFWYRRSDSHLASADPIRLTLGAGRPGPHDPPGSEPGHAVVLLDARGRLRACESFPPAPDTAPATPAPALATLLAAAGVAADNLVPTTARFRPVVPYDARAAWLADGGTPRIETATLAGRPVALAVVDARGEAEFSNRVADAHRRQTWFWWVRVGPLLALLPVAIYLSRRHHAHGLADAAGAQRLAAAILGLHIVGDLLLMPHASSVRTQAGLLVASASGGLLEAGLVWLLYGALEPLVRRYWPQTELAWARLLTGRWRDPLVGADLLIGGALGAAWALLIRLSDLLPGWLGLAGRSPVYAMYGDVMFFSALGVRPAAAVALQTLRWAVYQGVLALLLLVVLRMLVRRPVLAAVLATVLLAPLGVVGRVHPPIAFVLVGILVIGSLSWTLMRLGLAAAVTALFVCLLLCRLPVTADLQAWYADAGLLGAALALAVLAGGFALARRPQALELPSRT